MTSALTLWYEAGWGIRPPRRGGRVRGVAREFVTGGGMDLWSCDHDHAPGVKDCRRLTPAQANDAADCAERWITERIRAGSLFPAPVTRDLSTGTGKRRLKGDPPMANDTEPLPRVQGEDWTRAQRVAWCKERAADEPWTSAIASMIGDMQVMGIPLSGDAVQLGMMQAMSAGERGVRDWIDSIQ